MNKICQILNVAKDMNKTELIKVSNELLQLLSKADGVYNVFAVKAAKCRKCNAEKIVKFGKDKNGKQRYKCKSCGTTFTETSYSVLSYSRYSDFVWNTYIQLLLKGAPLEECAFQCGISVRTAFIWRHKILNALQKDQDNRVMAGIVEADETFIPVSYKGNHKKSKNFIMPRDAFKRGTDNRSNKVSKACVLCAIERKGQSYAEVLGLGQLTKKMAKKAFTGRIAPDSIVISDRGKAIKYYFDRQKDVQLIRMQSTADGSRHSKIPEVRGVYHIQTVNNFHNRVHRFLRNYNGVSTKYLNHYIALFVWIENHKSWNQSMDVLLRDYIVEGPCYVSAAKLFDLPSIPCAA